MVYIQEDWPGGALLGPFPLDPEGDVGGLKDAAGLAPGDYVLGWRWDCEQSNQIWQSCSAVRVEAKLMN